MKKICIIIICMCLFFSCSKKSNESYKEGKFIKFSDKLFGINFCTIEISNVINILRNKGLSFKSYNGDGKEIKYTGKKDQLREIFSIKSRHFIGSEIDTKNIMNINYSHHPCDDSYAINEIFISLKEEYYNKMLELLKKQFGYENMFISMEEYGEISWYADPDMSKPTCIQNIVLTKKLKYDTFEAKKRGVCYLIINTRSKKPHVH